MLQENSEVIWIFYKVKIQIFVKDFEQLDFVVNDINKCVLNWSHSCCFCHFLTAMKLTRIFCDRKLKEGNSNGESNCMRSESKFLICQRLVLDVLIKNNSIPRTLNRQNILNFHFQRNDEGFLNQHSNSTWYFFSWHLVTRVDPRHTRHFLHTILW